MASANQAPTAIDYALQLAAGTAAILTLAFGGDPSASNRTGFYGDLTGSAEKIATMVGGIAGPYFQSNGVSVDAYFPTLTTGRITTAGASGKLVDYAGLALVSTPSATAPSAATNGQGTFNGIAHALADAANGAISLGTFGGGASKTGVFGVWAVQGTAGSPGATIANDALNLRLYGHDGSGFVGPKATISLESTGTWSGSSTPARIRFATCPSTSATAANAGIVDQNQVLSWGGANSGNAVLAIQGAQTAAKIQANANTTTGAAIAQVGWFASAIAPTFVIAKSRSSTVNTQAVITTGDTLGTISFQGDDGTNFIPAATIVGVSTGTIGTGAVPGVLRFQTATSAGTMTTAGQIDSTQALVWGGANVSDGTFSAGTQRPHIQTSATTAANANMAQVLWSNSTSGSTQILAKSRGATANTHTVITTGDTLGTLSWQGDDGTNFIEAAQIVCVSTGTIGTGQIPGILRIRTASSAGTMSAAFLVDSTQNLVIGNTTTTSAGTYIGGTVTPRVQIKGTAANSASAATVRFSNDANGPSIYFAKGRSSTIDTMTIVTTGDALGTIDFSGADGTNFVSAARIIVTATGTVGASQIPGNMVIQTATTGGTLTTALTIDNAQMATFAGGITLANATNIVLNTSTGTKIGTATTQKLGLWNVTPVVQPATTGTTTGFTAGSGTAVKDDSTFTGGSGSTAYRISDIVLALKQIGAMAA